jgi:hypothetical protein
MGALRSSRSVLHSVRACKIAQRANVCGQGTSGLARKSL